MHRFRAGLLLISITAEISTSRISRRALGNESTQRQWIPANTLLKRCPWYPTGMCQRSQGESPAPWDGTLVPCQWDSLFLQPPPPWLHAFQILQRKDYSVLHPHVLLSNPSTAAVCAVREAKAKIAGKLDAHRAQNKIAQGNHYSGSPPLPSFFVEGLLLQSLALFF